MAMIEVLDHKGALENAPILGEYLHRVITEWPYLKPGTLEDCITGIEDTFSRDDNSIAIIARDGDNPVAGTVRMDDGDGFVTTMFTYVAPEARGQGLLKKLLSTADAEVVRKGLKGTRTSVVLRDRRDPRAPSSWVDGEKAASVGFELLNKYHRATWIDIGDTRPTIKVFRRAIAYAK